MKGEVPGTGRGGGKAIHSRRNEQQAEPKDAISKMLERDSRKHHRRGESNDKGDQTKNGLGKASQRKDRGRSQPQTEEYSAKGMFQSLMPFLFQNETSGGGKGRTRK